MQHSGTLKTSNNRDAGRERHFVGQAVPLRGAESPKSGVQRHGDSIKSKVCASPPPSRRLLARIRAAMGLAPRKRGGQPGNRNRLIHGRYTQAMSALRARNREIIARTKALTASLREFSAHVVCTTRRVTERFVLPRSVSAPVMPLSGDRWIQAPLLV
jgi:hypothetical protein